MTVKEPTNICIIDDNPDDLKIVSRIVKRAYPKSFQLLSETREDLMERISWVKPDLIICDYRLRSCTGLDILMEIKRIADIPFIFCSSALNENNEFSESILNGASGYILKDNLESLPDVIQKVLDKHEAKWQKEMKRSSLLTSMSLQIQRIDSKIKERYGDQEIEQELEKLSTMLDDAKGI